MIRKAKTLAMTLLLVGLCSTRGLGQVTPTTILEIDVEARVAYTHDVTDYSKLATESNITNQAPSRNFATRIFLSDIVAVNGKPVKGVVVKRTTTVSMSPNPTPGVAISDTRRGEIGDFMWEILQTDGTPIGTIMASGLGGGSPAPGAPSAIRTNNLTITGGTGAFLGVRGQAGIARITVPGRFVSVTEDPANRRIHGGGARRFVLHLIPLSRPEIVQTLVGPAVAHSSDFALVTASKPAAPGEILSLFATGLGPTRPGVDPGKPFPTSPLAAVNSPVEVTVNGRPTEVLAAVGYPGAVDGYQVNFRVPPETARGVATIQVSVAWIVGPEVRIAVQ